MDSSENTALFEGMGYAMLMLAEVPNNRMSRLIYHVHKNFTGDDLTVIYLWKTSNGYVAIGDVTYNHNGKFISPDTELLGTASAKLKMIKDE